MAAYDVSVKIVLVGDSGVGKSALALRHTGRGFSSTYITTIGTGARPCAEPHMHIVYPCVPGMLASATHCQLVLSHAPHSGRIRLAPDCPPTRAGCDMMPHKLQLLQEYTAHLEIVDTAGQARFQGITFTCVAQHSTAVLYAGPSSGTHSQSRLLLTPPQVHGLRPRVGRRVRRGRPRIV